MRTKAYASNSYNDIADFIHNELSDTWTDILAIVHNSSSETYVLFYKA